jgi:hypothetical protein
MYQKERKMKVGDLFVYNSRFNNTIHDGQTCIYLGECFIHRSDGVVVQNHKILFVGDSVPTTIDIGVLKWLKKVVK